MVMDGCLSFTKSANKGKNYQSQANLTCGSLPFCEDIVNHLQSLNIKSKVYKHGRKERVIEGRKLKPSLIWRVVLSGSGSVYNLTKLCYNGTLAMPRKLEIANKIIAHREKS